MSATKYVIYPGTFVSVLCRDSTWEDGYEVRNHYSFREFTAEDDTHFTFQHRGSFIKVPKCDVGLALYEKEVGG